MYRLVARASRPRRAASKALPRMALRGAQRTTRRRTVSAGRPVALWHRFIERARQGEGYAQLPTADLAIGISPRLIGITQRSAY